MSPLSAPERSDPQIAGLVAQLTMISPERTGSVEVRYRPRGAKRKVKRQLVSLADTARAGEVVVRLARCGDVWLGPAVREDAMGSGRRSHVAWAEVRTGRANGKLMFVDPAPALIAHAGDCMQAWWALREPVGVEVLESINAHLAQVLGGEAERPDPKAALRALTSHNYALTPPYPVTTLVALLRDDRRHTAEELLSARVDLHGPCVIPSLRDDADMEAARQELLEIHEEGK